MKTLIRLPDEFSETGLVPCFEPGATMIHPFLQSFFKKELGFLSMGLILTILCTPPSRQETPLSRGNHKIPEVITGKIFLAGHTGDHTKDTPEILFLMKILITDTINQDFSKLHEIVSPKDGLLLDLKGTWSREEIRKELKKSGNYFATYFFDRELLKKQKNSENVRTVRDLFLLSGGIEAEFYYESLTECELKLRFKDNIELEKELLNPYFKKVQGKWYLHRMF